MEKNTFATSVFVQTEAEQAFAYLRQIKNLDQWTLGSRMVERIDDDTWMGTASGYQAPLCYHVRVLQRQPIPAIEWQCGYTYKAYFKQYPVLVFPSRYLDPNADERGSYIHWVSVIDPARRTPMIMQGIETVHRFEARALKAALERRQGLTQAARGRYRIDTDTIYVDAPLSLAVEFVSDVRQLNRWAPLFRPQCESEIERERGRFSDEYNQTVDVTFTTQDLGDGYTLVEQNFRYPETEFLQRCLFFLIPSQRAFGPKAQGLLLHRITFWDQTRPPVRGRLQIEDFGAENMACKRHIEALAGNHEAFARGMSYEPPATAASARPASRGAPPAVFSPEFADDPYPLYATMRDDYPLYFDLQARAWILSRYQDVRTALQNPAFTTRSYAAQTEPLLGKTIIQLDGREHSRQRDLLAASFKANVVGERYGELIEATVDELLAGFRDRGRAELMADFVTQFPVRIMAGMLGLPQRDWERFRGWYSALIRGALNLTGDEQVALAATRARDELDAYLRRLLEQGGDRRGPGDDILSSLAAAELDGQRLSDDELVRFGMLMVFAAGETTEKGLATTLRNLIAHPEQLAQVRADRSLIPRAVNESFRFTAPTHMVPRKTSAEVRVSGGLIPAGAEVMCFLGAANRDPRRFAEPDRFDIFRPEVDPAQTPAGQAMHLAFGAGRHYCPGAALSRLELEIALNKLLDALADLRFADGADYPPPDRGLFLRCPEALPVTFTPLT